MTDPTLLDPDWRAIPLEPDDRTEIDRSIGFDAARCSSCGALTRKGICLNACHLRADVRRRFFDRMAGLPKGARPLELHPDGDES